MVHVYRSFYITMTSLNDVRAACDRRASVRVFYLSHGMVRVCEIYSKYSHMGKNNGHPYLVCENKISVPMIAGLASRVAE